MKKLFLFPAGAAILLDALLNVFRSRRIFPAPSGSPMGAGKTGRQHDLPEITFPLFSLSATRKHEELKPGRGKLSIQGGKL